MERKAVSGIVLALLLTSMLTLAFNVQPVKAEPTTIIVPDDYSTIQAAINSASDGDAIYVRAGIYYENIMVNKILSLIGENRDVAIIDGGGPPGTVIRVIASNVAITGFTIRNGFYGVDFELSSYPLSYNNIMIFDNKIESNTAYGIFGMWTSNNTIEKNIISNNGVAIEIQHTSKNRIVGNEIWANYNGVFLGYANQNVIQGNDIYNARYTALSLGLSNNNTIHHNNFINNTRQVAIDPESLYNIWDDGYPSGGNYWSDYEQRYPYAKELDGSGIWDTPYIIDEYNRDRYPLMKPWTPTPPPTDDVYWLAKAIMSEASVGTQEEQIAVGWTVLNRLDSGRFGNSIEDVVKGGYAYNQEPTDEIRALAKDLLERKVQDPTYGAMYFFSPRSMPKEGDDTTGFDVGGGLHQVPYDGQDKKVWFPSWAKPEKGTEITEYTARYLTAEKTPRKLEWRNLTGIRNWYFMFYRSYTKQVQARAESPVELRVFDSEGRVTGLVNGKIMVEIPMSDYNDNAVTIFFPFESYRYDVVGKDTGLYGLTVTAVTTQENITFVAFEIPTSTNATHQYTIDWDVLSQGEEGVTLQIDSDGDGVFEQIITADSELTHDEFLLQTATVIDFDPDTLNLRSKGQWITAYIQLPEGYNAADINATTILLNGTIPAVLDPKFDFVTNSSQYLVDHDGDGILERMVKFNRTEVSQFILGRGIAYGDATLTLTGQLTDGTLFEGSDVIQVKMPGDINIDGTVDMKDLAVLAEAFGSYPEHPRWNYITDENEDNKIDYGDLWLIAKNFGKAYS